MEETSRDDDVPTSSCARERARALTVDDGWTAVTDNYVKVRLDAQRARNVWIDARIA